MEDDKFYELVDLYRNPDHYGKPETFNFSGEGYSASCGDKFRVYLRVEGGIVKDASFEGKGCVISTVSLSKLCSYLIGRKIRDVEEMNLESIKKLIGIADISISRVKCATVGLNTVKNISREINKVN
jgi:nitrogen fixation NifU-like protein